MKDGNKDPLRKSCDYCARMKRACDGCDPCELCLRRRKECTRSIKRKSGPAKGAKYTPRRNKRGDAPAARESSASSEVRKQDRAESRRNKTASCAVGESDRVRGGKRSSVEGPVTGRSDVANNNPSSAADASELTRNTVVREDGPRHERGTGSEEIRDQAKPMDHQDVGDKTGQGEHGKPGVKGENGDRGDSGDQGQDKKRRGIDSLGESSRSRMTSQSRSRLRPVCSSVQEITTHENNSAEGEKRTVSPDTDGGTFGGKAEEAMREVTTLEVEGGDGMDILSSPSKPSSEASLPHINSTQSDRRRGSRRSTGETDELKSSENSTRDNHGVADVKPEANDRDSWPGNSERVLNGARGRVNERPSQAASPSPVPLPSHRNRRPPIPDGALEGDSFAVDPSNGNAEHGSQEYQRRQSLARRPSPLSGEEPPQKTSTERWYDGDGQGGTSQQTAARDRSGKSNLQSVPQERDWVVYETRPAASIDQRSASPGGGGEGESVLPPLIHFWDRISAAGRRAHEMDGYVQHPAGPAFQQKHDASHIPLPPRELLRRLRPNDYDVIGPMVDHGSSKARGDVSTVSQGNPPPQTSSSLPREPHAQEHTKHAERYAGDMYDTRQGVPRMRPGSGSVQLPSWARIPHYSAKGGSNDPSARKGRWAPVNEVAARHWRELWDCPNGEREASPFPLRELDGGYYDDRCGSMTHGAAPSPFLGPRGDRKCSRQRRVDLGSSYAGLASFGGERSDNGEMIARWDTHEPKGNPKRTWFYKDEPRPAEEEACEDFVGRYKNSPTKHPMGIAPSSVEERSTCKDREASGGGEDCSTKDGSGDEDGPRKAATIAAPKIEITDNVHGKMIDFGRGEGDGVGVGVDHHPRAERNVQADANSRPFEPSRRPIEPRREGIDNHTPEANPRDRADGEPRHARDTLAGEPVQTISPSTTNDDDDVLGSRNGRNALKALRCEYCNGCVCSCKGESMDDSRGRRNLRAIEGDAVDGPKTAAAFRQVNRINSVSSACSSVGSSCSINPRGGATMGVAWEEDGDASRPRFIDRNSDASRAAASLRVRARLGIEVPIAVEDGLEFGMHQRYNHPYHRPLTVEEEESIPPASTVNDSDRKAPLPYQVDPAGAWPRRTCHNDDDHFGQQPRTRRFAADVDASVVLSGGASVSGSWRGKSSWFPRDEPGRFRFAVEVENECGNAEGHAGPLDIARADGGDPGTSAVRAATDSGRWRWDRQPIPDLGHNFVPGYGERGPRANVNDVGGSRVWNPEMHGSRYEAWQSECGKQPRTARDDGFFT